MRLEYNSFFLYEGIIERVVIFSMVNQFFQLLSRTILDVLFQMNQSLGTNVAYFDLLPLLIGD